MKWKTIQTEKSGDAQLRKWVCATLKPDIRQNIYLYVVNAISEFVYIRKQCRQKLTALNEQKKKCRSERWKRITCILLALWTLYIYIVSVRFDRSSFLCFSFFYCLKAFFVCVCTSTFVNSILCFEIRIYGMRGSHSHTHSSTQVQKPKESSSRTTTTIIIISSQKIYVYKTTSAITFEFIYLIWLLPIVLPELNWAQ